MPPFVSLWPSNKQRVSSGPVRRSPRPRLEELEPRCQPSVVSPAGGANPVVVDPSTNLFQPSLASAPSQPNGSSSSPATTSTSGPVVNYFYSFGVSSSAGGIGTAETPGDATVSNFVFLFGASTSSGLLFSEAATSEPLGSQRGPAAPPPPSTSIQNLGPVRPPPSLTAPLVYGDSQLPPFPQGGEMPRPVSNPNSPQPVKPSAPVPTQPSRGDTTPSQPSDTVLALPPNLPRPGEQQQQVAVDRLGELWSSLSGKEQGSLLETAVPHQEGPRMDWKDSLLSVTLAVFPAWTPLSDSNGNAGQGSRARRQNG